jgi:hypothetical protein
MKKPVVMFMVLILPMLFWQCKCNDGNRVKGGSVIKANAVKKVANSLTKEYGEVLAPRIEKGVSQAASLWQKEDGTVEEFETFCKKHFIHQDKERELVFNKISRNFEILWGHFNKVTLDLQWPLDIDEGEIHDIDHLFGGYNVYSHLDDDFYRNKIAFITVLNFPFYSLQEKTELGPRWSRQEWAYARLGDIYTARVPAELSQDYSKANTAANAYIARYNLFVGHLLDDKGETLFPKNLKLLSHWNLRDEIKANYGTERGLEKQQMIYEAMKRIVSQEIPQLAIDSDKVQWNPFKNKVFKDGKEIQFEQEADTRYRRILDCFNALRAMDVYYPESMNTYIKRKFSGEMEIAQPEVEKLFTKLVSSPQVKQVAQLIKKRLNRDLQPFDIWYDGFKARSGVSQEKLDKIVKEKYPDVRALEKDLVNILKKLGFSDEKAAFISSRVEVDAARGSGHAWGPQMKAEKAHLRTRVPEGGMNYKGYNIAVHEFGHNVEQTISLHDVDYYILEGVPNTAFTEALAFVFQGRDLFLLGIEETNPDKKHLLALDTFWSAYEIMGVSLVDMNVWKWLYKNPDANAAQLKEAVVRISKEIWNKHYADVMGVKNQTILGVYSHMVHYPLYLSAYSYGHLIDFQVGQYIEGKDLAVEVQRMFSAGRLVPQLWMKNAVGKEISIDPLLTAVDSALKNFTTKDTMDTKKQ